MYYHSIYIHLLLFLPLLLFLLLVFLFLLFTLTLILIFTLGLVFHCHFAIMLSIHLFQIDQVEGLLTESLNLLQTQFKRMIKEEHQLEVSTEAMLDYC